jgi:dolichol kinase
LITGAVVASLVEVLPLKVNDNLSVGVITVIAMTLVSMVY